MEDRTAETHGARDAAGFFATLAIAIAGIALFYPLAHASPAERMVPLQQPAPAVVPVVGSAARTNVAGRGRTVRVRFDRLPALSSVDPKVLGFQWPVAGSHEIISPFGPRDGGFHHGADIGCGIGQPLYASRAGRVIGVGDAGPVYGLVVMIDHGSGYQTLYAHLSKLEAQPGQSIRTREEIGRCGATGNATGPHVHFEIRYGGYVWDPVRFLP